MASDTTSPAASGPGGYEFTGEQNRLIGDMATKMKLVGLIFIIFGFLNLINAFLFQLLLVYQADDRVPVEVRKEVETISTRDRWIITGYLTIVGATVVFVGAWTRSAGGAFEQVVKTSGRDINHVMEGFSTMRKMYSLLASVLVAAILATLVLIIYRAVGVGGG